MEERRVTGRTDWPLAAIDRPWDVDAARKRIQDWAKTDDGSLDPDKLKSVHFYYDESKPAENITSYKLLFCDVIDGEVFAIPRGIFAVAAALMGARGGVDIPDDEIEKIKKKVEAYYEKMNRIPPWKRDDAITRVRSGDIRPQSYDEKTNTIEVIWTTGKVVRRRIPFSDIEYDEELDLNGVRLERLNTVGVFLKDHDSSTVDSVIGRVVPGSAKIVDGKGIALIKLSDEQADAPVINKIKQGLIPGVSVGYRVYSEEVIKRQDDVDLVRVTDWEPYEISLVTLPADSEARVRGDSVMDDRIDKTVEINKLKAEAELNERIRVTTILDIARRLNLFDEGVKMVKEGISVDEARKQLFDAAVQQDQQTMVAHVHIERDEKESDGEAMVEYLMYRSGTVRNLDRGRKYVGYSLLDLAKESLLARGISPKGLTKAEIVRMALQPSYRERSVITSVDLPNVLGSAMYRNLRKGYEESPNTWRPWVSIREVPDFRYQHEVLLSAAPTLQPIDSTGEYVQGTLVDSGIQWKVSTYGVMLVITREAIINDDLGAFRKVTAFGAAASRTEHDIVYGLLLSNPVMPDNKTLFHADHGNVASIGSALSISSVGEGRKAMRLQKGLQGEPLNLVPKFLLVPAALETVAAQLFANIQAVQVSEAKPEYFLSMTPIVEPRLDAVSSTAWYLIADPSQVDTIVAGYLEGQTGPYVETYVPFEKEVVEIKIRHDFGAGVVDYRGFYKNPGSST